jgi:hypothetical protein
VPFEAYARAGLTTVTVGYAFAADLATDTVTLNAPPPASLPPKSSTTWYLPRCGPSAA